jgi:hypothetical protein
MKETREKHEALLEMVQACRRLVRLHGQAIGKILELTSVVGVSLEEVFEPDKEQTDE